MIKVLIPAIATVLSGCATTVSTEQVPVQLVGGSCFAPSNSASADSPPIVDPSTCRNIMVKDTSGTTREMDITTTALPGDWIVLRCWNTQEGVKDCASRADKIDNQKRLRSLISGGSHL